MGKAKGKLSHVYFLGDRIGVALLEAIAEGKLIANIDQYRSADDTFRPVKRGVIVWSASASSQLGALARDLVRREQARKVKRGSNG